MHTKKGIKEGGIAIVLLLIMMVIPIVIGSYATLAVNNQRNTQRAKHYMEARIIAENAVELGANLFYSQLVFDPTLSASKLQTTLNGTDLNKKMQNFARSEQDKENGYEIDFIHFSASRSNRVNRVNVVAGVQNNRYGVKTAINVTYLVIEQPFLDYSIFTAGIFELAPSPKMFVDGDVRSNDMIRLGSGNGKKKTLTFKGLLWASSDIEILGAWGDSPVENSQGIFCETAAGGNENFLSMYHGVACPLDFRHPNWEAESQNRWGSGQVLSDVPALKIPVESDDMHQLIEPIDKDDDNLLRREKMAWKATRKGGLTITVNKNGKVSYQNAGGNIVDIKPNEYAKIGKKDNATGIYSMKTKNKGWVFVDENFEDGRETSGKVRVVNIYMDQLLKKFNNTKLIYIKMEDDNGNITPYMEAKKDDKSLKLPAVRIRNGNDISAAKKGITIATHRMLYLEGNYNKDNKVSSSIMGDNLTVLSNGWNDKDKKIKKGTRTKESYYCSAFVIGGYAYDRGAWSGSVQGIQNLVRYREDWNGIGYHYHGSYIKLFDSHETDGDAHNKWFRAPDRYVTYNKNFRDTPPPGMPTAISVPVRVGWYEITWDQALAMNQNRYKHSFGFNKLH